MGIVLIYSNNTDTTLNQGAFVMYPIHVVLLKFMAKFRLQLVQSCQTGWMFPVRFEKGLNNIEIADQSGYCDNPPMRPALEVVEFANVVSQTFN